MISATRRAFNTATRNTYMLQYTYVKDAYYKRSKTPTNQFLVPHREAHEAHIDKFKKSTEAKIVAAPFFPHTGAVFFLEFNSANATHTVESFVKSDPYQIKGLVTDYSIQPVNLTH